MGAGVDATRRGTEDRLSYRGRPSVGDTTGDVYYTPGGRIDSTNVAWTVIAVDLTMQKARILVLI